MQRIRFNIFSTIVSVLLLQAVDTRSELVNFEGLGAMGNSQGSTVPAAAQLSNQLVSSSGVVFSSAGGSPYIAVVRLGEGHAKSGTNGIGGVSASGGLSYSTPIEAAFVVPSNPAIPAIVDFVAVSCDRAPIAGTVRMEAFDESGVSLGSTITNDGSGVVFGVTNSAIHSVRISCSSSTVAFDDLTFSTPRPGNSLLLSIRLEGSQPLVSWMSVTNHSYQLQFTSLLDPTDWTDLGAPIPGDGTISSVPIALDQPSRFYRVSLLP